MYNYAGGRDKFVNSLVNMTDDKIRMYEWSSGEIKKFYPAHIELPETPIFVLDRNNYPVFFIIKQAELDTLRKTNRTLDDIAVISSQAIGRNGKEITYLVWARDMTTRVNLYNSISIPFCRF